MSARLVAAALGETAVVEMLSDGAADAGTVAALHFAVKNGHSRTAAMLVARTRTEALQQGVESGAAARTQRLALEMHMSTAAAVLQKLIAAQMQSAPPPS